MIALVIVLIVALLILFAAWSVYHYAFDAPPIKRRKEKSALPPSAQYTPHAERVEELIAELKALPGERVYTSAVDGLKLSAMLYAQREGAPVMIAFHGYRSDAPSNFCGGQRIFRALGFTLLLVDQRAHGESEGRMITFGAKERYDVLSWVQFVRERFGEHTRILLCGVSMGATTVLLAGGLTLPANIMGIIADCGYTSPKDIIMKVIRDLKLPASLVWPFARFGAIVFGHTDVGAVSALQAVKACKVPVLFIHGEDDRFVPHTMGVALYQACASPKRMLSVPGAGHALSFLVDEAAYTYAVSAFARETLNILKATDK